MLLPLSLQRYIMISAGNPDGLDRHTISNLGDFLLTVPDAHELGTWIAY